MGYSLHVHRAIRMLKQIKKTEILLLYFKNKVLNYKYQLTIVKLHLKYVHRINLYEFLSYHNYVKAMFKDIYTNAIWRKKQ